MRAVETARPQVWVTGRVLVGPESVRPPWTLTSLVVLPQVPDQSIVHVDDGQPGEQFAYDDVRPVSGKCARAVQKPFAYRPQPVAVGVVHLYPRVSSIGHPQFGS